MARRRLLAEALEPRALLATAPAAIAGSPIQLPTNGAWTDTPFVASPVFADLNGDGKDEMIVSASGGRLIAYTVVANGAPTRYQEYDTGAVANFKATPIVVTMPNGRKAIFAALGRDEANPTTLEDGRVFGWDAQTGQILPGWPQGSGVDPNTGPNGLAGVTGPLASGDLDGNGQVEIVVTSFGEFVTAYYLDGSIDWRFRGEDSIESGAVVGDLDRDGKDEVVFGSDSTAHVLRTNLSITTNYADGGWVNILSNKGSLKSRYFAGEAIWSSPTLVDLYGNGYLEIVVGTGLTDDLRGVESYPGARAAGNQLIALNYLGQLLPGWPYHSADNSQAREFEASPVAADLLGNGQLEVIATDLAGYVHVINAQGQDLPGWSGGRKIIPNGVGGHGDVYSSPIIADVDGDGHPDVIATDHFSVTAFDRFGNTLWTIQLAEPVIGTPAIGKFTGSTGLQLAFVENALGNPDRPDKVGVYQLTATSLTPPWPLQRRSANGVAVAKSLPFEQAYVNQAYVTLLGRGPDAAGFQSFVSALMNNSESRTLVAQQLIYSLEGQSRDINALYTRYLKRTADASGLAYVVNFLGTGGTLQDEAANMLNSPEYATAHGGTAQGIITGYYNDILGRAPDSQGLAYWLAQVQAGSPLTSVSHAFLVSPENVTHTFGPVYGTAFPGQPIATDSYQAILADYRADARQQDIEASILSSGGNYATTNTAASFVRSVYRDLLYRNATTDEVASWLSRFNSGLSTQQFAQTIINSSEARTRFIAEEYAILLGRAADAGGLAGFANSSRSAILLGLTTSNEYYARNGSNNTSYVQAVYRDIVDYVPAASDAAGWVQRLNSGLSRASFVGTLLATSEHANAVAVTDLFRYIPDESQGILRTGNGLVNGPPTDPDANLLNYVTNLVLNQGEEGELAVLLTSPQYFSKSAYYKGFFQSRGIRQA